MDTKTCFSNLTSEGRGAPLLKSAPQKAVVVTRDYCRLTMILFINIAIPNIRNLKLHSDSLLGSITIESLVTPAVGEGVPLGNSHRPIV